MPHGHCYLWKPSLVATHVVSDTLIGLAYISISLSLYSLIKKIKIPFSTMFIAFGLFIAACGMTHFMEVWNLWQADYWVAGLVKVVTAIASVATAIWLVVLTPQVVDVGRLAKLSEQRGEQLQLAYQEMEQRVKERTEEVQQLYLSAKRANELKDEFLTTMSHELRTPLSVIMGFSDILLNQEISEEERNHLLESIHRNSKIQEQMVNDLLDVSMIIAGKIRFDPMIVNVVEPLNHVIENMGLAIRAKGINLETKIDDEPFPVLGDPMRLQQIIWNLLSNAVKFTERGGTISIKMLRDSSCCLIEVKDNGIGIDPSFLPYVFERFRQEDAGLTRNFGGLGLGLGIVRHLVELHGGSVKALSEGRGKGATFQIRIPIAPIAEGSIVSDIPHYPSISLPTGLKVLLVDDEADIREYLAIVLRQQGCELFTASSAKEGLELIKKNHPDLLISDIGMPGMDGIDFIRQVREGENQSGEFLPALALTAYAHSGMSNKIMSAGYQGFLTKPTTKEALLGMMGKLIHT